MPTRNNRLAALALTQGMVDPFRIAEFLEPILAESGVPDWLAFFVEKGLLSPEQVERLEKAYAAADPAAGPPPAPHSTAAPAAEEPPGETEPSAVAPAPTGYADWLRESDTLVSVDVPPTHDAAAARSLAAEAGRRAGVLLPGADLPPGATPGFPAERKFAMLREIGRGGVARVFEAVDRDIGRRVAIKVLRDSARSTPRMLEKLIEEAQITGQLEHPNIVPVHDLGLLPSGEVFFAMRLVRGRTLAEVLRRIRAGDEETSRAFSRTRLLTILQQVCLALDLVHERGVIHRDLKPENLLVGDHGEVYVMDWGLARVLGRGDDTVPAEDAVRTLRSVAGARTLVGTISGTPSYMPPEQALGNTFDLDAQSDVYSLGAILYEVLTLVPPFTGRDAAEILAKVVADDVVPPRSRAPERDIPPDLEEICLRALCKRKAERPARARELSAAIEAFLEGSRERRRKRLEADERIRAGRLAASRYQELRDELRSHESAARETARTLRPWGAVEEKQRLWELEDRCESTRARMAEAFAGAVEAYSQAMGIDPSAEEARDGAAELYLARMREAEEMGNEGAALHFRTLLGHFAGGRYAPRVSAEGRLRIVTQPAGARVTLWRYQERDRVLVPEEPRDLVATPAEIALAPGSYLAVCSHQSYPEVRAPVEIPRGAGVELRIPLCTADQIGEGFVYVPGGPYLSGGDPLAVRAEERHARTVAPFAIGRYPVTCGDYIEFLNHLPSREAQARAPRATGTSGFYWTERPGGGFTLDEPDPDGDQWDPHWPVIGISWNDAQAYCVWYGRRTGRVVRLPTREEWEKAARGTDGRIFPWGNRFDASFCKMEASREGRVLPEPIGSFAADESPYGVRDLAGTVQEWTASRYSEGLELRILCGSSWRDSHLLCRTTWYRGAPAAAVSLSYGFRLAVSL